MRATPSKIQTTRLDTEPTMRQTPGSEPLTSWLKRCGKRCLPAANCVIPTLHATLCGLPPLAYADPHSDDPQNRQQPDRHREIIERIHGMLDVPANNIIVCGHSDKQGKGE